MEQGYSRLGGQVSGEDAGDEGNNDPASLLGPAYARSTEFWKHILGCVVFGCFMGLLGYGYLQSIEWVQEQWMGEGYAKSKASVDFLAGNWVWLAVTTVGGLAVGVSKVLMGFPATTNGFFKEVKEEYVEKGLGLKLLIASWISLAAGASLGPEAALGSLGGGLGRAWSEQLKLGRAELERNVVNGMAAAMGALFPNPIVAVCCMVEVGKVETMHVDYMRSNAMMTVAAGCSFAVFFAIQQATYLPFNPIALTYHFEVVDLLKAALIGVISGLLGVVHIVVLGLTKTVFELLGSRIGDSRWRMAIMPALGGLLIGGLYITFPLTIGSGSRQVKDMTRGRFGHRILFASAAAKSLTYAISVASGFIGGNLFPMVFIGAAVGIGFHDAVDDSETLPFLLSLGCFMAGVPASVSPIPFTILLLVAFSFQLGQYQAAPIFITCITAHLTTCGCGLILRLLARRQRQ